MMNQVIGEFPPAEFGQELLAGRRQAVHRGGAPDLSRADLAEGEIRRQTRRAVDRRHIARLAVVPQCAVEEVAEAPRGGLLTRRPALAQSPGPVGSGR